LLEIASALEGQFVFQIPFDELVIFDEFTIEARRDRRWFSSFYGAGVHGESLPEAAILPGRTRAICEMIGT
jgi:hypothetical protein